MKKLMFAAVAVFAGGAWATDYTWNGGESGDWRDTTKWSGGSSYPQSGDTATFNTAATVNLADVDEVDKLVLNARVLFTSSDNKQHRLFVKALGGTGLLALQRTYFYFMPSAETTVSMPMEFVASENGLESRVLRRCAYNLTFTGAFTGDGKVRLAADNGGDSGASSAQSIILDNDQSAFTGTFIFNSVYIDRFVLANAAAISPRARYEVTGTQSGNVQTELAEGTLSFGSFYTEKVDSELSYLRFNNASSAAVMEIGAANGEKGSDRLTLRMGNIDKSDGACSYVKIRKVGTGNLDLGETRHSKGTEINDGTVTVVHPSALLANVKANTEISFGGGTLRYGASVYADTLGDDITTDYSAYIKNSKAPVSIDTNGKDITWETVLSDTNANGTEKKGEGTLALTISEKNLGEHKASAGIYDLRLRSAAATLPAEGQTFAREAGGALNVTIDSTVGGSTRPNLNLNVFPDGSVVNVRTAGAGHLPRLNGSAKFDTFKGVLNFLDNYAQTSAGGLVNGVTTLGSDTIDFGILGDPETVGTRIFDFECANDVTGDFRLGAIRFPSAKAVAYIKLRAQLTIGAMGRASYLNGTLMVRDAVNGTPVANHKVKIVQDGEGSLKLGEGFKFVGETSKTIPTGANTPAIEIVKGTFENHADLTGFLVTIAPGATLKGDMTTVPASALANYTVELPAKADLDKEQVYDLVKVPTGAAAPTVDLTALNAGETKGKWKIRKNAQGIYQLFWVKNGFALILR